MNGSEVKKKEIVTAEESYYMASQWQLMRKKFLKHKIARVSLVVLSIFYFTAVFCEFIAPYTTLTRYPEIHCPPQKIHFIDDQGFHLQPFVYKLVLRLDTQKFMRVYTEDKSEKFPIRFFVHGEKYKLWNLFETDVHLFGVKNGTVFLFGTDKLGRDLFSRTLYASRVSLSIGLVGVFVSFVIGVLVGGISGYYGGRIDMFIQRIIEFLLSIPTIPLWMALAAALPPGWSPITVYLGITIILSMVGWCGVARVVRGKFLELREEDFVMAAKISGATDAVIIIRHLVPSFLSYLIVRLTLSIPGMILGETALSFLGLGLRPPVVSWGVLLQQAQSFSNVSLYPWLLIPGIFVIGVVLAFNFSGDGLRDAADPYK
ncbi:MAG: ABC transporter permease [Spirochaetota bacterium]